MKRLAVLVSTAAAAAALAAMSFTAFENEATATSPETLVLSLGDRIRVDGADIGCRVTRFPAGKRLYLDCRRAGALRGTYGTYFGEQQVLVVRFVDATKARIVFRARHHGTAQRCQ